MFTHDNRAVCYSSLTFLVAQDEEEVSSTGKDNNISTEDDPSPTKRSLASVVNTITDSRNLLGEATTSQPCGGAESEVRGEEPGGLKPEVKGGESAGGVILDDKPGGIELEDRSGEYKPEDKNGESLAHAGHGTVKTSYSRDVVSNHSNSSAESNSEPSIIAKGPAVVVASTTPGYHPEVGYHADEEPSTEEEKDTSGELADGKDQRKVDSGENTTNEAQINILSDSSGADERNSTHLGSSVILAFPPTPPNEGGRRPQPRRMFDGMIRPLSGTSSLESPMLQKSPLHSKLKAFCPV